MLEGANEHVVQQIGSLQLVAADHVSEHGLDMSPVAFEQRGPGLLLFRDEGAYEPHIVLAAGREKAGKRHDFPMAGTATF